MNRPQHQTGDKDGENGSPTNDNATDDHATSRTVVTFKDATRDQQQKQQQQPTSTSDEAPNDTKEGSSSDQVQPKPLITHKEEALRTSEPDLDDTFAGDGSRIFDVPSKAFLEDSDDYRQTADSNNDVDFDPRPKQGNERTKSSSLELRRLPVEILLTAALSTDNMVSELEGGLDDVIIEKDEEDSQAEEDDDGNRGTRGLIQWLCLSPKYKLKTQMMLSFGIVNLIAVILVLIGSIAASFGVGGNVKRINENAFKNKLVPKIEASTALYLAESLEQQFMPLDLIDILMEAAQDRFVGYPESMFNDDRVPFRDIYSGNNVYPLIGEPLLFDWQVQKDITESNYDEHVQKDRWEIFFQHQRAASTASGVFLMKGACDPNELDEMGPAYWPNCTDENNNATSGGVIAPVPSAGPIYRKAADIGPLLKAMFEITPELQDIGIYFASMGAGASLVFPAYAMDTQNSYTSVGCDWMSTPNPIDPSLGPIGTPEEIARCAPEGEVVSSRLYNPMERGWCRDQALNPDKMQVATVADAFTAGNFYLSIGRAMYDRETNSFVGCVVMSITLPLIEQVLHSARVTENSEISLIKFDESGTVVVTTVDLSEQNDSDPGAASIDQLRVGVTKASYENLNSLVEAELEKVVWHPADIRDIFESFSVVQDGFLVAVSPIPAVPNEFEQDYRPEWFVIVSTSAEDVFKGVQVLNEDVNKHVQRVTLISLIIGLVGFCVTAAIIMLMSNALTSPLQDINDSAENIVHSFADKETMVEGGNNSKESKIADQEELSSKHIQKTHTPLAKLVTISRWAPRTELTEVLVEFNKIVANFSGSLLAKSEKGRHIEVKNPFCLQEEFSALYASRKDSSFKYNLEADACPEKSKRQEEFNTQAAMDGSATPDVGFIHIGSNLEASPRSVGSLKRQKSQAHNKRNRASLFLWTVALFVTPLLITTVSMSTAALLTLRHFLNESLEDAEHFFVDTRVNALVVHSKLRAALVSGLTAVPMRDLYILTRYTGWLLFGGLKRADSFTEVLSGTEACKGSVQDITQCPFYADNYVCDCAWNDVWTDSCEDFPNGSRHLQTVDFAVQRSDSFSDGNRNSSSFPSVASSPETTEWWDDPKTVPGWEKGSNASGYSTLYDRLRVSSAMPLFHALYNYDKGKENYLSQAIAFEADGLFVTYDGCFTVGAAVQSTWKSTVQNRAAKLRPNLCPVGKFGYDARCRGWYDTGRSLSIEKNVSLHITAPYVFAFSGLNGQSGTMPLVDPSTGQHVGQTLYDFLSNSIFQALEDTPLSKGGFPLLISAQGDRRENTILGPNYTIGDDPTAASNLALPTDARCKSPPCRERLAQFDKIVDSMEAGEPSSSEFIRAAKDGGVEKLHLAYAPVKLKSLRPLGSDFRSGVEVSEQVIYSLGLCEVEKSLLEIFEEIREDLSMQIVVAVVTLSLVIVIAVLFIVYMSYLVATSITEPMLYLLELIRCINRSDFDGDPPEFEGSRGSSEIIKVSDTVLILYRIVRAASEFFFAGELEQAYSVLEDALRMFKTLGNDKAIAVASNNLGNVMTGIYREMEALGLSKLCGLTKKMVLSKGTMYFQDSIKRGEDFYDKFYVQEGWTPNCLDFMQHLSNRYFNRALFVLSIKGETASKEITMLGMRDLEIARDMDFEIVEYSEDIGFNRENRSHKLFSASIIRIRGHNMLLEMGYPDDYMRDKGYPEEWELEGRLDEIFALLRKENERESSELFHDVNVVGRLQEVETELIKYKMLMGDLEIASKIAIRMLTEDAYIFAWALTTAVNTLIKYTDTMNDLDVEVRKAMKKELLEYLDHLDHDLEVLDESTRVSAPSVLDTLASTVNSKISQRFDTSINSMKKSDFSHNWAKKHYSGGFVTMEDF